MAFIYFIFSTLNFSKKFLIKGWHVVLDEKQNIWLEKKDGFNKHLQLMSLSV